MALFENPRRLKSLHAELTGLRAGCGIHARYRQRTNVVQRLRSHATSMPRQTGP